MRRSKVNNVEYGFLLWVGSFLIAIVMGMWLGTLLVALQAPEVYGALFSSASTVLASIVASASIVFGVYKYKQEREFTLAMQLPFSQEVLQKQKEFYEEYMNHLDKLHKILFFSSGKEEEEIKGFCDDSKVIVSRFRKWLSPKQIEMILLIENKYSDLYTSTNMTERLRTDVLTHRLRHEVSDQHSQLIRGLLESFDTWKNELKEVFFVDTIVEKQARILSGKT